MLVLDVRPFVDGEAEADQNPDRPRRAPPSGVNMALRQRTAGKCDVDALTRQRPRASLGIPATAKRRDVLVDATLELIRELPDDGSLLRRQSADATHDLGEAPLTPRYPIRMRSRSSSVRHASSAD
jgi:hypothetical protein